MQLLNVFISLWKAGGTHRHSVIVADALDFAFSNPFLMLLASVLHECLWINPCKCGQACVHLHVKMHMFSDRKILPDK